MCFILSNAKCHSSRIDLFCQRTNLFFHRGVVSPTSTPPQLALLLASKRADCFQAKKAYQLRQRVRLAVYEDGKSTIDFSGS